MNVTDTIEGLYSLFSFDKTTPEGNDGTEDKDTTSYAHPGWYIALGVCLFVGLKTAFRSYFPSTNTSQTKIVQRKRRFGLPLTDIIRRMFGMPVDDANTINPVSQVDPIRSMLLPRTIRKSLQEKSQTKILRSYNVHGNMEFPQMVKNYIADISKVSELSSWYQDAVSGIGQSLKGQNSMNESTRVSSQASQEKPVRIYSVDSPRPAGAAFKVTHTSVSQFYSKLSPQLSQKRSISQGDSKLSPQLSQKRSISQGDSKLSPQLSQKRSISQGDSKLSPQLSQKRSISQGDSKPSLQLSQKQQCQQLEVVPPQSPKHVPSQHEEMINSNTRCIGGLELDVKLPVYLTYPNPEMSTHQMRSVFSRSKLGKKCSSEAKVYDDLRFEDDASCHTSLNFAPEQKISTMQDMLKAPTSVAKKTCDISGTDSHHGHSISHTESHNVAATSGVKTKSGKHLREEKGFGVRSIYASLMCLNKTQNILTAPVLKYEDFFHDSSNPTRRKRQKVAKDRLEAIDEPYTSCPGKHPLVFEIFAPGASKVANTGKADGHCHISDASFENQRSLKRSRRSSASKDEHCDSVSVDILEVVATKMQAADFKKSKSSKMARKRKQITSGIQTDTLESKIKEDHRSLAGNDIYSSFTGTDISLCVHNCKVVQGLNENQRCHCVEGHSIRPAATVLNLAEREHSKHGNIPGIRRKMPQTSNVHTKQRHKSRKTMLSLSDRRPETIHMVESLLSVTGEHLKCSSKVLANRDASISQTMLSRKGKSIVFSVSPAETDEKLNIQTAFIPEHVNIDFVKMPYENRHIKNKTMVKKNLRFAADTEKHGASKRMFNVTLTEPSTGSKIQQIVRLTSENAEEGQTHRQSNKTYHRHAKSSNDYQKLAKKFILQNKDDIKNAIRVCQSVEPNICEEMHMTQPQSPASVWNKKTRSRTMQYPSLMSFLDHIERRNNGLKDRKYIHREDKKRHTMKNSVCAGDYATKKKWADKDAFVTQKMDIGKAACLHGSKLGSGTRGVGIEGKQVNSLSDVSGPHLITPSYTNKTHNLDANLGLHFGTNNLQLYSESVDSIIFPMRDNQTITDVEALVPCQSKSASQTKQNYVLKSEPTSNTECQQQFRRSKTECGSPTTTENRELKTLRRTSFRTTKKELSQKTLTHEHNDLHKVKPSVLTSRKQDTDRPQTITHHQAIKNVAPSSSMKLQSKTKHGLTQSRFAIPDPTRGSENLDVIGCLGTGGGDSPKMSDAQMLITESRIEKSTHSPSHDAVGNIDTFKDIISLDHHQLKSPMSGKSKQLLSPNRSHLIKLPSPHRISAVAKVSGSPAHLETSFNEMKSMYPSNKVSSPVTKVPSVLKAKTTKDISAAELQLGNTQPRIRKRIRRLKTSSLGHVISKLSEAEIKPPKDDALRSSDVSSTSKSLPSTDINTTQTIPKMASDTKDKMPVIVKKLLISSTKRQSDTLQTTSGCEKQHLPQKEPASPVPHVVPASRSLQPLQSIRRGSLKDIFDRYMVHTTEYSQRNATKMTGKPVRYTKNAESDMHCSLPDQCASLRSASTIPSQVKPEVSQRNISSYTSKYRASDNIDKSVKSPWRGTVAFRKRLQHLLQHNKHIKDKYQHINMTAKKTSSADTSPSTLNSCSLLAGKDKLASKYKVSRIVRPGHDVNSHDIVLNTSESGKGNNIYSVHKVVTPVSKLLDVRHESMDSTVDNGSKDIAVFSVKSAFRDKSTDAGNNIVPLIVSPAASNPLETSSLASSQKWTSSKSIITHSDHYEQKIQCQLKRQRAAMDHKLHQMRGNLETKPLINVKRTGTPTKPSVPGSVFNRRAFGRCPRVALQHKLLGKEKEKQKEAIVNVAEATGKDLVVANERAKSVTEVVNSPHTFIPGNHQVPNSEGTVPETVNTKLPNAVQVVGLDSGQSVNSNEIQAEVTRCDFTSKEEQFVSAGDTRFMATIKKEMTHVSETEHNLQLLLDKIKHRSFIVTTESNDKEKEDVDTTVGITENPDINANTIKKFQLRPKLGKNQKSVERLTHTLPSIECAKEITEQTKSNFITDKKAVASTACATNESFPSSNRIVKESTRSQMSGIEIIRIHEGNKKTDSHVKSEALSKNEITFKNMKHSMTIEKSNTRIDKEAKISARKIMYSKYRLMPRIRAKRLNASLDSKTSPAKESCTTVVPNVKHVAFNLNEVVDKSNTESYVTIKSETASQGSSETLNTDFWCKEVHDDDTDMLDSHSVKTASVNNKVRQTKSVLNILSTDVVEQVDKKKPRKDIQNDQVSDTSHTYERQQSSTENTSKLPCSSGYGSMDILSTTSFSQLHNSSSVESGKLAIEMATAHGIASSYNQTQGDVDDDAPLRVCKQSELFNETAERVTTSLTTNFWKKEMHMDVIPEEADNENGIDNQADLDNCKSKLTELEVQKLDLEETFLKHTTGKEYVTKGVVADETTNDDANKIGIEDINKECEIIYHDKCKALQEDRYQAVSLPVPKQDAGDDYMEMCADVMESSLGTHPNERNNVIDTRSIREASLHHADDIVWNASDTACGYSPPSDTCVPEEIIRGSMNSPHLNQAVTETVSQIVGPHMRLINNTVLENESCDCSVLPVLGYKPLEVDVSNAALDCPHITNQEEAHCEKLTETPTHINGGNNIVADKDSSSFTTEPNSERPDPCNHHMCSSLLAKTLDTHREVSQSKSDSSAAKHEIGVCDLMSATEVSKQSMFLGERNKSDLTTVPLKSTTYDIQESKSLSSMPEQSYCSSDNSLSEGVFKCTDDLEVTSCKQHHEEINTQSIAKKVGLIVECSHKENTDFRQANHNIATLRTVGSSSRTELPNSDDESTFQKLSEPSAGNLLVQGGSPINLNKTRGQEVTQSRGKQTPDTNMHSPASSGSETTMSNCSRTGPACITALDQQPTVQTQTSEFNFYSADGARMQTSVGLQTGYAIDEENFQRNIDNSSSCQNRDVVLEAMVSSISSLVELAKEEKYRSKITTDTKSVSSSSSRKDKIDQNDQSAVTVIHQQNANATKERPALQADITKKHRSVARDTGHQAHPEGSSQSAKDDLESLLNKELSQVNALGGVQQECDVNRLFGTYYGRNTRREKRRRRTEKTLNQPSQRELQYHFMRENDGSVKNTSSNTSQRTIFSPSDAGTQQSSRARRPLSLGRVTKLEEFLQKAEETNRSETMSNISRAVSKLSSLTSVTPTSQEVQLTPLTRQTRSKLKQKAAESTGIKSHEASEKNSVGGTSLKSSQLSRSKNFKVSQLQFTKISENQHEDNNGQFASCTSNNDQSPYQDCVSDCTGNNSDSPIDRCSRLHMISQTAEQSHGWTYSNQVLSAGYDIPIEMTGAARAKDNMPSRTTSAEAGSNTYPIQNETTVDVRALEVVSPSKNLDKHMAIEQVHLLANTITAQTTDECSALSTSSSSIVLSWIGSDVEDTEEIIQTPNFTVQDDKLYSDVSELNNYYLHTRLTNEFPQATENVQQSHIGHQPHELYCADVSKLWQSTFSDSVPHSMPLGGIILQESKWGMPGYGSQYDSNEIPRTSYLSENIEKSPLPKLKQSKEMAMHTSLPRTEHAIFETHTKEAQKASQAWLPSSHYFKFPETERCSCSPASQKTPRQICSFWNNNPKECMLEQPSYFNALLRDPKWNPSFEVKEVGNKVGHKTEENSATGSYVKSAWKYQRVRHMSPSIFSPQKGQDYNSSTPSDSVKQECKTHVQRDAHLVSSTSAQQSNTNISFDVCCIHSNELDPHNHQHQTTQTPPRSDFVIQQHPAIQHHRLDQKSSTNLIASQGFSTRAITKQNTFLKKVHFDGNFQPDQTDPAYLESIIKPDGKSWPLVYTIDGKKLTQQPSLDKHLRKTTRSGALPMKGRLPSEQRSQGPEASKTKTKLSLEQHLCSAFGTDRNPMPNAAQPSSENGTTKSTSSHASLNWYKPQSLPSSTSVSNGNTSHSHQETSTQQETAAVQERPYKPLTPQREFGITLSTRRSTSENTRRQDTHTLEHSAINRQNLATSLPGSTHGQAGVQKSKKFSHRSQNNLLTQTLIPSLVPRAQKVSSESLSTLSSISAHSSNKYPTAGLWWLQDPGTRRVTRHNLPQSPSANILPQSSSVNIPRQSPSANIVPQSPSGSINRTSESKSTPGLTNASNQPRRGSKPSDNCEVQALANQSRGVSSNNKKQYTLSNNHSHSSTVNSGTKSEVPTKRAGKSVYSHVQPLKKSGGLSDCSATTNKQEPRTSVEDLPDARNRTKALSTHLSDTSASKSHHLVSADSASPFKGTRRVSKLVEMFEKKFEN
ncbi:hypothetical protein BsWGS_19370 [Bradybaena similaris]